MSCCNLSWILIESHLHTHNLNSLQNSQNSKWCFSLTLFICSIFGFNGRFSSLPLELSHYFVGRSVLAAKTSQNAEGLFSSLIFKTLRSYLNLFFMISLYTASFMLLLLKFSLLLVLLPWLFRFIDWADWRGSSRQDSLFSWLIILPIDFYFFILDSFRQCYRLTIRLSSYSSRRLCFGATIMSEKFGSVSSPEILPIAIFFLRVSKDSSFEGFLIGMFSAANLGSSIHFGYSLILGTYTLFDSSLLGSCFFCSTIMSSTLLMAIWLS